MRVPAGKNDPGPLLAWERVPIRPPSLSWATQTPHAGTPTPSDLDPSCTRARTQAQAAVHLCLRAVGIWFLQRPYDSEPDRGFRPARMRLDQRYEVSRYPCMAVLSPASRVRAMATVLADEGRASYRHITPVRFSLRQPVQQRGSTCRCLVQ